MKTILLSREAFKESVFNRDQNKCVVCGDVAVDAHHILDRKLFLDGGYYLDNGVAICSNCHIKAESTIISCQELRRLTNIKNIVYPDYLGLTEFVVDYDKWGNPILKNGKRLKGYYFDLSKIDSSLHHLFEKDYEMIVDKYPRTYHGFNSPGTTSDDRISKNVNMVLSGEIIQTEKLDGSNTSFNKYGVYGRSRIAPSKNSWDSWLMPYWEMFKNDLGDLEICGENMYGVHSIKYSNLDSHFYIFGIRDMERDMWLSWEEVEFYANMLDFPTVPVLFRSTKNWSCTEEDMCKQILNFMSTPSALSDNYYWETPKEGIVTRIAGEFPNDMFYNSIFKYVRKNHVQTDEHWQKNWKRDRKSVV